MLYQRYANPMELLDNMLITGQLYRFVSEIIKTVNEELEEKALWEFWLHKDWERSWPEFRKSLNDKPNAAPTQQETLDIVNESMNIMASFCPVGGGGEDGAIQTARGDSDRRDASEQDVVGDCPESGNNESGS